jgi:hypothetical protein
LPWRTWTACGGDRERYAVTCAQLAAMTSRQCERHARRMRTNGGTKSRVVELHVEPATAPAYVDEAANDRCWNGNAQSAIAFGAGGSLEAEHTVSWQDRLDDSFRHSYKLQLFVSKNSRTTLQRSASCARVAAKECAQMGRLPLAFAGKDITFRIPYTLAADLDAGPNASGIVFPEASFLHNVDKPFEIHRIRISLTAKGTPAGFTSPTILEPQPTTLAKRVRLRITDFSKNENLTKSATLVNQILQQNTQSWDLEEPYTIVRSEGFQVQVDTADFPAVVILDSNLEPERVPVTLVRVEVSFQGYLDIIGPPSETR